MDPDATYKRILSHAVMVKELLRWLVAERHGMHSLVDALDFSTLTRLSEQSVGDAGAVLRRHSNDMVWRVHLHGHGEDDARAPGGTGTESSGPWLYLVVMLEFQSTVDYLMPLRIRNYVDSFHMEQWRGRRFGSTDRLAPVLPIVLYMGTARWTAAQRVIDLVTPQAAQARGPDSSAAWATSAECEDSDVRWRADPRFTGDGYVLLDSLRVGSEDLSHGNAAALLAGLENPSEATHERLLSALTWRLRAPELQGLRAVLFSWAAYQTKRRLGLELEVEEMMRADRLEDYADVEAYFAARIQARKEELRGEGRKAGRAEGRKAGRAEGRKAGRAEGREAGRAEGRAMGQRESLRRHAAMKFDAETAARLGAVLDGITDPAVFDAVLAALLECDTPSGLLERAAEARRRTNGRDTPADG